MVLNVGHLQGSGRKKTGSMGLIHMDGFNGILDTGKEEDLKMVKEKLVDGKELLVDLKVFYLK